MESMFINIIDDNFRYHKIKMIEAYLYNIKHLEFSKTF